MDMHQKVLMLAGLCAAAALSLSGCVPDSSGLEQKFTGSDGAGFSVKGSVIHSFDPVTWQVVFSASPCEFTVCSDSMSDYYTLRCSRVPGDVGDVVECDAEWTTYSDIKVRKGLDFEVVRTDKADGALWLWCSSARIGAVVMIPE